MAKKTLAQKLAANLLELEIKSGLTTKEAVKKSTLPQMTYYRVRSGSFDAKLSTLEKMANGLGVTAAELLK